MKISLAEILRPQSLDDVVGQEHLTGLGTPFRELIESGEFGSFILYGPNGVGKTSIINAIASSYKVFHFNATTFAVKELRSIINKNDEAIIHVDDCYRLSAPQSDVLLPHMESGKIRFLGCSVENPLHSLRSSLISRCLVFTLEPLKPAHLARIIIKAINYLEANGTHIKIERDASKYLIAMSRGDARQLLLILDAAARVARHITLELVKSIAPSKYLRYTDDFKYNALSWHQGSIQASNPDAAIYALALALEGGIDPRVLARRIMVSASEDACGDPHAAMLAHSAYVAACEIGRPECDIILAHATVAIATAPRNKSAACAIWEALKDIRAGENIEIPKEMRDCHYKSSELLGHGAYHDGMNMDQYVGINRRYYYPERWT